MYNERLPPTKGSSSKEKNASRHQAQSDDHSKSPRPFLGSELRGGLVVLGNHIPASPMCRARDMRPLWRDLKIWGGDPLQCPCCPGTMKPVCTFLRREEIEFFLRLQGLWEGVIQLPSPPPPPFDIQTMEPIEPPWQAIKEWIPDIDPGLNWFNQERDPINVGVESYDQTLTRQPVEVSLSDGRILVLDDSCE
ncbi:MAG: hypothetical protein ACJ0HK_07330 [Akkermansiaceae bacterium]